MEILSHSARCLRISVPDVANSFQLPDDARFVIFRNAGTNDLTINFEDDSATDFWTLKPGEETPAPLLVKGGTTVNTDGIGGNSLLEVILWG